MKNKAAKQYSPKPNALERKAAAYVATRAKAGARRTSKRAESAAAMLSAIQRRAAWLAVGIGLVSGGLIGASEIYVRQDMLDSAEEQIDLRQQLPYWAAFLAFAGLVSAVEILILYWIALSAIANIYAVAGTARQGTEPEAIERGLARAGLEFPNPREEVYGIDPYAYVPQWQLTALAILYRLKVGISSFIVRLLFRRVLSRMVVRGLIPLLAGPLYAIWNAIITFRILREAKIRALGPPAIEDFMPSLASAVRDAHPRLCNALVHGTAEAMMCARDAHPNHVILLSRLIDLCEVDPPIRADWPRHRDALGKASKAERREALRILCFAVVLASKVTQDQQKLLRDCCGAWRLDYPERAIAALRAKLLRGEPLALDWPQTGNAREEQRAA